MRQTPFRCFVIGSDTLLMECTDHLRAAGHEVLGVVTDTPRIAAWARERGLDVVDPFDDLVGALSQRPFDHLFAITWLRILPDEVLALPRGRAVNFHDGPLPAYAGLNAPAWALMDRVDRYGVTWHEMVAGVDRGDVLLRTPVEVADDETALSLNMKCFAAARDSFPHLVEGLAAGTLVPEPQDPARRTYFGRHDRPDRAGFLDWTRSAADLDARVRALDFGPYPNALGRARILDAEGRPWLVVSTRVEAARSAPAATVVRADDEGVAVATSEGTLVLTALAEPTGRPAPTGAAGPSLAPGSVLPVVDDTTAPGLDDAVATAARHESFWARRLETLDPAVLPDLTEFGDPESVGSSARAAVVEEEIPVPRALTEVPGVTPAAAVLAAWAAVIARAGRRAEFDLGWWGAGQTPGPAGLFAPWRPLRIALDSDLSIADWTAAIAAAVDEVEARGPFLADLVSRIPGAVDGPAGDPPGLPVAVAAPGSAVADERPPVLLQLPAGTGPARLTADPARLPPSVARALAAALAAYLDDAAGDPHRPWTAPSLLDAGGRQTVVSEWSGPHVEVPETFVHEPFEAWAAADPRRPAVRAGGETITYGDLDRRANALAHRLRELGVGPDTVVGVYVERSIELMVATLGVLKAGGAYLPLDPAFPADRVAFMLGDAGAPVVVSHGPTPPDLVPPATAVVDLATVGEDEAPPPRDGLRSDHLAYVIYTSGSTGRPKGVLVEHRNVTNFFTGMDAVVRHDPPGVWMAVTSLSFDISVLELFWTLARGFEVVVHADGTRGAPSVADASSPSAPSFDRLHARGMEFGLFLWGNDDGPGPDKYRLMLDAGRYFDEHGFDSVWTPERHFHAFGGPFPNPSVTGAALAAVTNNLAIRSGSCVSPLHHPIRIAEEWAVVDNLSNGRVGLAFAAGWQPNDFVIRPDAYPDQKAVMIDQIEVVRRLWRGEAVEFENPLGAAVALTTLPRPVQPELPFWITTAGNPDTYRLAGRMGANVLTHLLGQSLDEVAEKIAAYREARGQAGLDPEGGTVTLMLHTFVGDDDDRVRELVREPMKDYLRASMKLVLGFAWTFPAFKRPGGPDSSPDDIDLASLSEDETEAILDFAFDRYYETSGLFGTPDTCVEIAARCAAIGVDEIACLLDFGVDTDTVLDSLPRLREVRDRANAVFEGRRPDVADGPATSEGDPAPRVTHLQCTPSMARLFLDRDDTGSLLGDLEHMMVGGEAFPEALSDDLRRAVSGRVTNMYGPTETTIWSTTWEVADDGPVPIGRPIANTTIRILDPWGGLVPPGLPGELCIGGRGVVRGYHDRPDLTAERFVRDPWAPESDARMYRTGDLARWRDDGVLEFLGRLDHQVKVRGYRIEPGEIEARLEARDDVARATVVLREDAPGDQRLVAYVVGHGVDGDTLREALAETLPAYMVPAHVVLLDRLPLTPNGKIDRNALPAPTAAATRSAPVVAPSTPLESTLVEAWKEVLGLAEVGTEDNFFDAGGHSLLVVQLHRLLTARIDGPLSLVDLYRFPTIRSLADHLSSAGDGDAEDLDASAARGARRREMLRRRGG